MKQVLKEAFFATAPKGRLPADRAVVLMYHSVDTHEEFFMMVSPSAFKEHMTYLKSEGYPVIPLSELVRRLKEGEPLGGAVAITFDDGYRDNLTEAFPVLKEYGFPATIFVTTDMIGKTDKLAYLTADDLTTLESSGLIAIEPHTKTHPKLAELSLEAAREEICGSKEYLENMLHKSCRLFAYPYGSFTDATAALVEEAGFDAAVTVVEGSVSEKCDLFRIPRVSIDRSTSFGQFRGKVSTAVDWYERIKIWR